MAIPNDEPKGRNRFQDDEEEEGGIPAPGWGPKDLYLRLQNGIRENRKRYAMIASAMLATGLCCFFAWSAIAIVESRRPTIEMAVNALDFGAYEQARQYASSVLRYAEKNEKEKWATAFYVYGVATCEEIDRRLMDDVKPFYRNAAESLAESRELGFMPDRETDGYFYLGKCHYFSHNYPAAIANLEIAREKQSPRKKSISWYLANAYYHSPNPDYKKGLEALERFLVIPPFLEREQQAAALLKTSLYLRLNQLDDAKTSFREIPTLADSRMILHRELAAGKIRMQEAELFRLHAGELERIPQLNVPESDLEQLARQLQETPLQATPEYVPPRELSASPFLLEREQARNESDELAAADASDDDASPPPETVAQSEPPTSKESVIAAWRQLATQQLHEALKHFELIKRKDTELLDLYRQAMYLEALCFEQLGDIDRAQEGLLSLTRTFPGTSEAAAAQFRWGYIEYILKDNPDAGLTAWSRFFDLLAHQEAGVMSPPIVAGIANVGIGKIEKLIDVRQYAKAEELLEYFRNILSDEQQARLFSRIYSEWAVQLENQAESKRNDEYRELVRKVRETYRLAGKWHEELSKWTFSEPDYLSNVWSAAEFYEQGRDFPKALVMYRRFLEHEMVTRQAQTHYRIGSIFFELNEMDAAIKELEYCIENFFDDPVTEPARLVLACAYQEKRQWGHATHLLMLNLDGKYSPDSEVFRDSLYELGRVYERTRDNAQTIKTFDEILSLYPDDPKTAEAHYMIAKTCLDDESRLNDDILQVQLAGQENMIRKSLEETQRQALEHLKQTRVLLLQQEERRSLDKAEDRMLRNTYFMIGRLLTALGPKYYEEALQENKTAVARYQNHPDVLQAYLQLARIHQLLGEPDQVNRITTQAQNLLQQFRAANAFRQDTVYSETQWQELLGVP